MPTEGFREAEEADEEAVRRAQASKSGLAERMRQMLDGTVPRPEAPEEGPSFAERLSRLATDATEAAAPSRPPPAPTATPVLARPGMRERMGWFLGRSRPLPMEGPITPLAELDTEVWEEVEVYPVDSPYAFVRLVRHRGSGEVLYQALEPPLSDDERKVLDFVHDALVRGLNVDPSDLDRAERGPYLAAMVERILTDYRIRLGPVSLRRLHYYVRRDFLGLGPLHVVMLDPDIEDISCDGVAEPLFVYHRIHESIATDIRFRSEAELDGFVIRLAQRSGKAISISDPILDAALPDGSRLQATLGHEVTQNGSTFTIRRFRPDPFTPLDLVQFGTLDLDMLAWFWLIVQHGHSLVFSGGTASGKTTGLNAISQFIPPASKVVSIEDTREVNLSHHNWIKAVTRTGSTTEGTGEIGMFELLKAALRQRPEYILVGEVRGIEATVAFQAMATGHTVFSTMHADSARSVVYRLENDPINIPRLVLQALDVIVIQAQVRIGGRRVRRIREVVELVGMDPVTKELLTNTVFSWDPGKDRFVHAGRSYTLERIARDLNWTPEETQEEARRRRRFLEALMRRGVQDVEDITRLIKAYYRDPASTLEILEA